MRKKGKFQTCHLLCNEIAHSHEPHHLEPRSEDDLAILSSCFPHQATEALRRTLVLNTVPFQIEIFGGIDLQRRSLPGSYFTNYALV
ncbi:hypothetical protein NPIL_546391 [Nephila pilipes]|uniref:Uncharacterized protein n=1 Tax=Nephila pilipes TaxID=299642 RepID=A0A8X6UK95_NEPPI|nr:hypothetical protein NPIL_546391 [Nephila pilipes]